MKLSHGFLLLFSCQFLHTQALDCVSINGNLKQIDAGAGFVVGVNSLNEVFFLFNNVFTKIVGSLKHVSVGPAGVLGVNAGNNIFKLQGGAFTSVSGLLKQIDAGGDQIISGANMYDDIFCLNMDPNNHWEFNSYPWVHIPGKLKYYSCGPYSCWGVNSNDDIFIRKDVTSSACSGPVDWVNIAGALSMIEVSTDGSVFGVNSGGNLYQRTGITQSNPSGTDWQQMTVCPNGHKHVSFDLGLLWAVCADGSIQKCYG